MKYEKFRVLAEPLVGGSWGNGFSTQAAFRCGWSNFILYPSAFGLTLIKN